MRGAFALRPPSSLPDYKSSVGGAGPGAAPVDEQLVLQHSAARSRAVQIEVGVLAHGDGRWRARRALKVDQQPTVRRQRVRHCRLHRAREALQAATLFRALLVQSMDVTERGTAWSDKRRVASVR